MDMNSVSQLTEYAEQLGMRTQDLLLLIISPICAIIGSFVHYALLDIDPSRMPRGGRILSTVEAMARAKWIFLRLFVGAALGLVLALYFIGVIEEGINALTRLLAFAVLIGYCAPRLWIAQEKLILSAVEKRIDTLLTQHGLGPSKTMDAQQPPEEYPKKRADESSGTTKE